MYEASFSGFLKTILIILMVYFGLKLFFKWFGPIILRYIMRKVGKNFERKFNQQQGFNTANRQRKEASSIDDTKSRKTKSNKDVGEYIEYEEID